MNTLEQQLAGQSLQASLAQLVDRIRSQPADADLRAAFTQLLCLEGNWTRAQAQLKSWLALTPQAQPTVTLLEQTIQGELTREKVLAGEAHPTMPDAHWPWVAQLVNALAQPEEAASASRQAALEQAEAVSGELTLQDGTTHTFDWLMDGDSRFGPVCELIVNGRYFWLPFNAIEEMEFQPPASVTDLAWRHTRVQLRDGSEQVCQIPARYPVDAQTEDRFRLGRTTEWQPLAGDDAQYIGQGQKVWLNDSAEFPLLDLARVRFTGAAADE